MGDPTMERLRSQLQQERDELQARLEDDSAVEPGKSVHNVLRNEAGMSDAASQVEQRSERLGMMDHTRDRLRQVEEALDRMGDGDYGRCEICGEAIGEDRLLSLPLALRCIDCAEGEEA